MIIASGGVAKSKIHECQRTLLIHWNKALCVFRDLVTPKFFTSRALEPTFNPSLIGAPFFLSQVDFARLNITAMSSSSSLMNMIDKLRATAVATSKDDFTGRSKLLTQIDDLRLAVETPMETLYRVGQQPWQNAAIRIALDIGIFGVLVGETDGAVNVDLLARETKADKALIIRLMRVLVALGLCEKVSPNAYEANDKTDVLTEPAGVCAYKFWFDLCMPTALKMPEYFRKHGNEEPLHYKVSPFAHTFGEEFWTWMSGQTIYSYFFGMHLMSRDYGRPRWFEKYPIEERLFQGSSLDDNAVLIVDVGGNDGQDLVDLREWFPTQHSTLILQDLPYVIDFLDLVEENIICMRHDFFESQPIKGALVLCCAILSLHSPQTCTIFTRRYSHAQAKP